MNRILVCLLLALCSIAGASTPSPTPSWTATPIATRPATFPDFAVGSGAQWVAPSGSKQLQGWVVEKPSYQTFNWIHRGTSQWLRWFDRDTQKLDAFGATVVARTLAIDSFGATLIANAHRMIVFATPGMNTFTVPQYTGSSSGYITVEMLGGGAGGGGGGEANSSGGGGAAGVNGTDGSPSSVASPSFLARGGKGGEGGRGGVGSYAGGAGGSAQSGSLSASEILFGTKAGANGVAGGPGTGGLFGVGANGWDKIFAQGLGGATSGANATNYGAGGAGGAGGNGGSYTNGGGGGGAGNGEYVKMEIAVTPGQTINVYVGAAGSGGAGGSGNPGNNGVAGGDGTPGLVVIYY